MTPKASKYLRASTDGKFLAAIAFSAITDPDGGINYTEPTLGILAQVIATEGIFILMLNEMSIA